jgi:hypothetical protein
MVGPGREGDDMAKRTKSGTPGRAGKGRISATVALSGTGTGLGGTPPARLYWSGDDIWAANLDGTNPQDLLPAFEPTIGVAVDSGHVYWINTKTNAVRRANPDGSNPQDLVPGQLALADSGLAVDASHLYWTNTSGTIMRANLDGALPQQIVTNQEVPVGLAVDATHLYWINVGNPEVADGSIWRANLDGTNPQQIISGQNNPEAIAVGS